MTADIIAAAEARASAAVASAIADLATSAHLAPEYSDDWFPDGRHRVSPTRAKLLGLLAHLRGGSHGA